MSSALSKRNIYKAFVEIVWVILLFFISIRFSNLLYSQEIPTHSKEAFYNYISNRFQEKGLDSNIHKKVWNYLSNPNKGYRAAGLSPSEFSMIVRDYIESKYNREIIGNVGEVMGIDTTEVYQNEDKSDAVVSYVQHIEKVAKNLGLDVTNINNKFLIVSLDGEQPPLGLVGRIRISGNYIEQKRHSASEKNAGFLCSSKLATETALFAMGILKELNLKPVSRIILMVDLSLYKAIGLDELFNSYEIPPVNLVLDSVFPVSSAEYGYATVRLNQNVKEDILKKSSVRRIEANGGDFLIPDTAILYFDSEKLDRNTLADRISKFSTKYDNVELYLSEDKESSIRFKSLSGKKGSIPNALDYLVLFLTENRDLYPESIRLFEYLRRNIVFNPSGKSLGINKNHPLLNHTEVILKSISVNGSSISAELYVRFPYGIDSATLVERIKSNVSSFNKKESTDLEVYVSALNPITIDMNSDVAVKLKRAYELTTGNLQKPAIYDGYYTKFFPNAVGFGPALPEYVKNPNADGFLMGETDIVKLVNIYITAFILLMER